MSSRRDLSTLYGLGLLPYAPGTYGSLVAGLVALPVLHVAYGWALLVLGIAWALWFGTQSASRHMRLHDTAHDPKEIIIDEVAGQWLTYTVWHLWLVVLAGTSSAITFENISTLLNYIAGSPRELALGFLLFRFFDIVKPWPICWADRKIKGGFGVMFDDVLAAVAAGTALAAIHAFWPLLFGQVDESSV